VPVEQDVALIHPLDAQPHELGHVVEVGLACWDVAGVDIDLLKVAEEQLAGGYVEAVRPENHIGKLKFGSYLQEVLGLVVGRPIYQDHGIVAP
jgi:hypothetical protein